MEATKEISIEDIDLNFLYDWNEILRSKINTEFGIDASAIENNDVAFVYENIKNRRIVPKVRKLKISNEFNCDTSNKNGWELLQVKIINGDDLFPHLSSLVEDIFRSDSMLYDWNLYHLHLGDELRGRFIKRTGPLLYAIVTDSTVYAVNIMNHGEWANVDLIEIIHNNWPELIEKYKSQSLSPTIMTKEERLQLRKINCNASVSVSDGTSYLPIGGGLVASGRSLNSTMKITRHNKFLYNLEKSAKKGVIENSDRIIKKGYKKGNRIKVTLKYENHEYKAIIENYGIEMSFQMKANHRCS